MTWGTSYFLAHSHHPTHWCAQDSLGIRTLNQLKLLGTTHGLVHHSAPDTHDYHLGWAKNGTHAPGHKKMGQSVHEAGSRQIRILRKKKASFPWAAKLGCRLSEPPTATFPAKRRRLGEWRRCWESSREDRVLGARNPSSQPLRSPRLFFFL